MNQLPRREAAAITITTQPDIGRARRDSPNPRGRSVVQSVADYRQRRLQNVSTTGGES
jgi:hypothetical protein